MVNVDHLSILSSCFLADITRLSVCFFFFFFFFCSGFALCGFFVSLFLFVVVVVVVGGGGGGGGVLIKQPIVCFAFLLVNHVLIFFSDRYCPFLLCLF